ncbi:MICOS complex subunit MIC25 isoform X2 [Mixophyes fleayi]|uniref:MICOS complex subunit MIC25 isoform X2 n=1 Tax=Mixophyes fleayi TaxID=3061075 RepID=UPI003F4E414F
MRRSISEVERLPEVIFLPTMGGTESTGRKVSFGMDEEERVQVLRGLRLSDDVVRRMKESSAQRGEQNISPTSEATPYPESLPPRGGTAPPTPEEKAKTDGTRSPSSGGGNRQPTYAEDDLYRRYEKEQAIIQEELSRLAWREREAAQDKYSSAILREKNYTNQERRRAEQLAKELKRKEEELKKLDAFHREQLASIEKKNFEIYKLTAEQFHTAATNAEFRVKKRSYDPVCLDLQSNVLKCYTANRQELLNCSDVAKDYRNCVREAQKCLIGTQGLPFSPPDSLLAAAP